MEATSIPASVSCPVCATTITREACVCRACRTPQHRDCAEFIGTCATFGCGGREFDVIAPECISSVADAGVVVEGPRRSPPVPRRGILGRMRAACALLAASPGLTVALVFAMFVADMTASFAMSLFSGWGTTMTFYVAWYFPRYFFQQVVQALLVISLISRARGKEHSFTQALGLLMSRAGRITSTALIVSLISVSPMMLVSTLYSVFPGYWMGQLSGFLVSVALVSFLSLAPIVAAIGREEEPEGPVGRSLKLTMRRWGHTLASAAVIVSMGWVISAVLRNVLLATISLSSMSFLWWFGLTLPRDLVLVLSTTYWLLYYLELRRDEN